MNVLKSGYVNHRMLFLKMDVVKMATGNSPVTLGGYTLRAMKMGPTFKDGNDWRAVCMKCAGEGHLDPNEVKFPILEVDMRGRFCVCFACQERGAFNLPKVELYKDMLVLWVMGKVNQGKYEEIARVCGSEITYITELGRHEGWKNVPYEVEVGKFWRWVERRLSVVEEGGDFFTNQLQERHINAYNKQNNTEQEVDQTQKINEAFARIEALLA